MVKLSGDLTGFEGTVSAQHQIRIPDASKLGENVSLHFWGGGADLTLITNTTDTTKYKYGSSQIESAGKISRRVGSHQGGLRVIELSALNPELKGRDGAGVKGPMGFAAVGGPLEVELTTSDGSPVDWRCSALNKCTQINLQNEASTHPLTWSGDLDLNIFSGGLRSMMIGRRNEDAEVLWTGDLLNSANNAQTLQLFGLGRLLFSGNASTDGKFRIKTLSVTLGADTDERVVLDSMLDFSGCCWTKAIFLKRGTGTCELNYEGNVLHAVRVEEGTLEINGSATATNLTVAAAGAVAGSATLSVTGNAVVDGTLVARVGASAPVVTVSGDVVFGEGATVEPNDLTAVTRDTVIDVMTWTGNAIGKPVASVSSPENFRAVISGKTLRYRYVPLGFIIKIK